MVDSAHAMVERAVRDNVWDVTMVGFNLLNPSARRNIFPLTSGNKVGVLVSYALRRALSQPARLQKLFAELVSKGALAQNAIDPDDPLGFLITDGGAA